MHGGGGVIHGVQGEKDGGGDVTLRSCAGVLGGGHQCTAAKLMPPFFFFLSSGTKKQRAVA